MAHAARALGLGVMLGCMIESGLGIAAGAQRRARSATTSTSTATCCSPRIRGRASSFVDGVQLPSDAPGLGVSSSEAYLVLAEGTARRPAPRQDRARRHALRAASRSWRCSTRRGRARRTRGSRSSARVDDALALRADDGARRRRDRGRPLPAGLARAAAALHLERARRRERPARVPRRRPRARRARARRTASSCATCAGRRAGLNVPDRREPRRSARDRAHGRLRLRDREDDRRARARPRGAAPRGSPPSSSPTGQTGIAIAGWGISVDAVVVGLHRRRGRAARRRGRTPRRRAAARRGPGLAACTRPTRASRSASIHGAAPHVLVLCHKAGQRYVDDDERFPIPPLGELVELHERVGLLARPARVRRSRSTRATSTRTRRAARSRPRRRRPACRRRSRALRRRAARRRAARRG